MNKELTVIKNEELLTEKDDVLSSDDVKCFESSYSNFMNEFGNGNDEDEAKRIIENMIYLLDVNAQNLDEIKNQKWFEKIWKTISGGNSKLRDINNQNLIKIQKGILFFFDKFANENKTIMQSVHFALDKVKELRFENEKVKYYLTDLSTKIKYKIDNIETRLDEQNVEIESIKNNNISYVFAGLLSLIGLLLIIFMNEYWLKWILGSLLIIVAVFMSIKTKFIYPKADSKKDSKSDRIVEKNSEIIRKLYLNIYKYFENLINEILYNPYEQLFNKYEELEKIIDEESGKENLTNEESIKYIKEMLEIEPVPFLSIKLEYQNLISQLIYEYNNFISFIMQDYLPDSLNLEILASIDYLDQSNLQISLNNSINPYEERFNSLTNLRNSLMNDYPRLEHIFERSKTRTFIKYFFEGDEEDKELIDRFINKRDSYIEEWNNIVQIVYDSVCEIQKRDCNEFIRTIIEKKFNFIIEEFNLKGISIAQLNSSIEEINKNSIVDNNVSNEK